MDITLRHSDFTIGEYEGTEVVQLRGGLAFDADFVQEMKEKGVKKYVKRGEQEEQGEEKDETETPPF